MYLHVGGESVKSFVEVVHLNHYAETNHKSENIRADIYELIVTRDGELYCDAEALDGHDGNGANERAYRNVNERV